jgi:hypothetical protein
LNPASEDESFLKRIITGDETWVYGCCVETLMQSSQWVGKNSSRLKNVRWVRSNMKVMLTFFFTSRFLCIMNSYVRGKNESLVLSQSAETYRRKCQEIKTSVVEKQLLGPPS